MSRKTAILFNSFLLILAVALGVYLYPSLPDRIASHWNIEGMPDDYLTKFWGVFLSPIVMAVLFLLFIVIPKIDPLKENIALFQNYYNALWVLLMIFMFYIGLLVLGWNLGYAFDMALLVVAPLAFLWCGLGWILEKSKRNWFMGIRTPWTLSSDEVWEKTHKLGGTLFKASGVLTLIALVTGNNKIVFGVFIGSTVLVTLITVVYSYLVYRQTR